MNQNARHVNEEEFKVKMLNAGVQPYEGRENMYDTRVEVHMSAAQKVLIDHGYRLVGASMKEGISYVQHFTSKHNPKGILLRYVVRSKMQAPKVVLGYLDATKKTGVVVLGDAPTANTETSDAHKMRTRLQNRTTRVRPIWIAAFKNSPFVNQ